MKAKGPILLLITAMLWGMAFVAQTSAAENVEPFTFNAARNFIGVLFLSGVIYVRKRIGHDVPPQDGLEATHGVACGNRMPACHQGGASASSGDIRDNAPESGTRVSGSAATPQDGARTTAASDTAGSSGGRPYSRRTLLVGGLLCGLALCVASFLQQAGITAYPPEAAASSRSGFVTATYMVMVAVVLALSGRRPHPVVFAAVGLAMFGMYLLCVPEGLGSVYVGDWLVLASAAGYAVHILVIDRFTQVDGVRLSRVQLLVAGVVSLVLALVLEHPSPASILAAAVPILYAGICSDGIAYTLQIIAQKTTDATVASIIMSLEAVFAAIGGWLLLSESLSPVELVGCALVFAAVLLSQAPDILESRKQPA